ncbi:LysR family transcriptional regulator [Glutamicibacter sp. NPDC087344]|uniref:LysR family transcriptional regulator n=1 Tax=Glutamicibacter sp. NPDC087344 TaxID=3363994 RepID=UPI0037F1F966
MQITQIEYFLAVAQQLSFTRGAQSLHVVQSAVSAGIKQLEQDLGAELFVRQGRSIRLSPAGEALLPRAQAILGEVQAARDAVDAVRGTVSGTVELGTLSYLGPLDMSRVLVRIHREHPGVVVRLRQTVQGTRSSLAGLLDGSLDLALLSVAENSVPNLKVHQFHVEPMVFVVPSAHRLAGRKRINLAEVAGEEYVDFPQGWGNRVTVDAAFAAQGLQRIVRTEVVYLEFALNLVRQGLGVAFLPQSTVTRGGDEGIWSIPVSLEWKIQLAHSTARPLTAAETVLMRAILEDVQP